MCVCVQCPPPPTYSVLNGGSQEPSSLDRGLLVACGDMKSRSGPSSTFIAPNFALDWAEIGAILGSAPKAHH